MARLRRLPVPARWLRPRSRTIRMRLTALYGSVFLFSSAGLLTIGYLVTRRTLRTHHPLADALRRVGFHPRSDYDFGFRPGTHNAKLVRAVETNIATAALHRLLIEYVISLVVITAIAMITGWLLAGRALAPLRRITGIARRVSGENLGERIALEGPDDELKELANTFDRMLERLDGAFASQRHFVANSSHELRTPLAIMRTEIDVALADADASVPELRAMGEAVRETVDRCERLIASLLLLARSEATTGHEEPLDLGLLAGDCVTDLSGRAQAAGVRVDTRLQEAWVDGDPGLIERLIANLVDNGILHNERGGWLSVATEVDGSQVRMEVANGGARIDPSDAAGLTQPFQRLSRSTAGFGLGLSIVQSIAAAHRGRVELAARADGGLEVTVTLPARGSDGAAAVRVRPRMRPDQAFGSGPAPGPLRGAAP